MRKVTLPMIAFLVVSTLVLSSTPALAAFGSQLGACTVGGGNGRGVTFDPATSRVFSTNSTSTMIFVSGPPPGCANMPDIQTNPGVVCGSLSWDPFRDALWCGAYDGTGRVWLIDDDTGTALVQFDYPADQSCYGPSEAGNTDGLAFDANGTALLTDDTIWASGDAATRIYHLTTTGVILGIFSTPIHPDTGLPGCNTGIADDDDFAAPASPYLWLAMQAGPDEGPHVVAKVNKTNPSIRLTYFVWGQSDTPGPEDIAIDKVSFAPKCALISNQFGSSIILRWFDLADESEGCEVADKEVTGVVLPGAQLVSTDPNTRTTTYRMSVDLLTNTFIDVVSLEQNNGRIDVESEVTFLASIDDGHLPGHVAGAYIQDSGSPSGHAPDLLTCQSVFDPDYPLDQTLVPCLHTRNVPGDGIRNTAESDLHFQMTQRANSRTQITRQFRFQCLVVGEHSITFYNKVEVDPPITDPNLRNNWWRAVLVIDCGIRSTPGKVTGGGYIDPLTGLMIGDATLNITDGLMAGVGDKANFGFVIKLDADQMVPTGNLTYYDHAADVRIKSTSYDGLLIACPHATFTGMADVNGMSKRYQVDVDDIDEPGSSPGIGPDTFTIRVLDGTYMASGQLVGGNIQVHKPPECG